MAKGHSENKEVKETVEEIEPTEKVEYASSVILKAKENIVESALIDDSKVYSAEVLIRFGKLSIGSKIEKKGSIIKVLLDKKLIKLI